MSSEIDRKLRYINYIGDGDSNFYSDVVTHDPYHGKEVKKLECFGHIPETFRRKIEKIKNYKKTSSFRWKTNRWKRTIDR